jgi:hypothetical protein
MADKPIQGIQSGVVTTTVVSGDEALQITTNNPEDNPVIYAEGPVQDQNIKVSS